MLSLVLISGLQTLSVVLNLLYSIYTYLTWSMGVWNLKLTIFSTCYDARPFLPQFGQYYMAFIFCIFCANLDCPQVVLRGLQSFPTYSLPSRSSPRLLLCAFFKIVFLSTVGAQKIKLYFFSVKAVSVSILAFLWEMRVLTDKWQGGLTAIFWSS